jgi:hypothetical protein
MDEAYRLVFRGEILDGQHPAVVRKRLIDALKLSEDQAEKLFSGSTVVLKRLADTKTAARYQGLFKQAGARLRVMPVAADKTESQPGTPAPTETPPQPRPEPASAAATLQDPAADVDVLPVGSDVLRIDERAQVAAVTVDISHLGILDGEPEPIAATPAEAVAVPDFSVADVGVDLVEHIEPEPLDIDPQFDLAEVGADIPTIPVDRTPAVDIAAIDFDVAEVGADIGTPHDDPDAHVPDISHLSVVAD